jgi:tetratricopeptide (TPR) repeat protein
LKYLKSLLVEGHSSTGIAYVGDSDFAGADPYTRPVHIYIFHPNTHGKLSGVLYHETGGGHSSPSQPTFGERYSEAKDTIEGALHELQTALGEDIRIENRHKGNALIGEAERIKNADPDRAHELYAQSMEHFSTAGAFEAAGEAAEKAGENERSVEYYQRAIDAHETKGTTRSLFGAGRLAQKLGQKERAIDDYRRSVKIRSTDVTGEAYRQLAALFEETGDIERAIFANEQLGWQIAFRRAAVLSAQIGKIKRAINDYRYAGDDDRAIELALEHGYVEFAISQHAYSGIWGRNEARMAAELAEQHGYLQRAIKNYRRAGMREKTRELDREYRRDRARYDALEEQFLGRSILFSEPIAEI